MKRALLFSLSLALTLFPVSTVMAKGTAAGTGITNKASVTYTVESTEITKESNEITVEVAELLDLELTWQDSSNLVVKPGEADRMLTFKLTNTGNGPETFTLATDNGIPSGDDFDPSSPKLYLDTNGDGDYDEGTDKAYDAATNLPNLTADGSVTLFLFNTIPTSPLDGELGKSRLTATAQTGSGSPGTVFSNAGGDGTTVVNAVVGNSGGADFDEGAYQVSRVDVSVQKSATIDDGLGGSEPVPGAAITYSIQVTVTGSGTAKALTVNDPVPDHTTFVPGTLKIVEGAASTTLTDAADGDAGEVVETPAGSGTYQVTARLGDVSAATKTVSFQVTID